MKQWTTAGFFRFMVAVCFVTLFVTLGYISGDLGRVFYMSRTSRSLSGSMDGECKTQCNTINHIINNWTGTLDQARQGFHKERYLNMNNNRTRPGTTTLNAYKLGYFKQMKNFPEVQAHFLHVTDSLLAETLPSEYYHSASDNCIRMLQGPYGYSFGEKYMGVKCTTNWTAASKPHHYNTAKHALRLGLPESYTEASSPSGQQTATFLQMYHDAILMPEGDVYINGLKMVPQRCMQHLFTVPKKGLIRTLPVYKEVFTISQYWSSAYFHAHIESLPRMAPYVKFLNSHPEIKIHIDKNATFAEQSMQAMGVYTRGRLVSGPIRARTLYLPAGTPCGRPTLFNSVLYSYLVRASIHIKPARNNIVLIQRTHGRDRYFKHHSLILKMLQVQGAAHGYGVRVFSDDPVPSFDETRAVFNSAVMIVAPHGAGLTNMIYSDPGTVIIEGLHKGSQGPILCYRNLASVLGMRYWGIYLDKSVTFITPAHLKPAVAFFLESLT